MQENEFEKQVKDMMEELHFLPSAPVWENVKKQIAKKKRRVLPFFLLFITVAIISGYLFYADQKHSNQNADEKSTASDNTKPKKDLPGKINNESQNQENSVSETQLSKSSEIKKINTDQAAAVITNRRKNETLPLYQPSVKKNNSGQIVADSTDKNLLINTLIPEQQDNVSEQQQDTPINISKDSILTAYADTSTKKNIDLVKNDSATKQKDQPVKKPNKNSKWQWGVSAMYGSSIITNDLLSFDFSKSATININNPVPSSRDINALKHPYNTADAYNFGIIAGRKISRHSYLNTGLNFVHLSVKSNTARNIDSSLILIVPDIQNSSIINGYYRAGSAETFVNNFNFISLPVTFQSDLFHIKKFSLSYNAGLSVMQLLSSKSLIYNDHTNSFFKNEALLRRTQFQLTAGLNLQLNTTKTGTFLLGPHFEYSFSTLLKNNDYNRLHFINYGLQAAWLFRKK